MRAAIRSAPRPSLRPALPRPVAPLRPTVTPISVYSVPLRPTLLMPRLFGFGGISSRAFFATKATVVTPDLSQAPTREKPAAEEPSKRRKRTYKRMKPNGSPEMEINNTLKALRQKARLSPRWISHVLLQCGKRSPDVRARTAQAIEIFETFNTLAQQVGEDVPAIVYSALIGALVNNLARRPTEAPDVLNKVELYVQKMRNAKHELALPTLTSLVRLYGLARRPEKAMEIVQGVEEKAMETDIQWYNTLIEMFYLNGASEKAKEVHDKLLALDGNKANTITYNLMMKIAVQRNDYRDVIELFKSMKERGVTPDDFSYLEAIRAAGRLSDPNAAQAYFDEMRASGVKPAIYVWTALVDAYCRSNAIKKAFELADEMRVAGVPPDTVIWRIIRDAAQRCGKGDMWAKLKPSWVSNLHAASLERQRKPTKAKTGKPPRGGEEEEAEADDADADAPRSPRRDGSGPTERRERGGERGERTDRSAREGRRGEGRAEGRDRPQRGDRPERGARPDRGGERAERADRSDRGRRPERGGGGERGDSRGRRPSAGREERGRRGGASPAGRGRDRSRDRSRDKGDSDK